MESGFAAMARSRSRSISLPTLRSSNKTQKAEREQLVKKLKSLEAAPLKIEEICSSRLSSLIELYTSVNELINSRETLLAYNQQQNDNQKWVEDWLEQSVVYLDVCSTTREAVLLLKASVCEVQSTLRRRSSSKCHGELSNGGLQLETHQDISANYLSSSKQTKKEIKKSLSTLKLIENKFSTTSTPQQAANSCNDHNQSLDDVISALSEASRATVSVLESILSCLFEPQVCFQGARKWSLLSKLVLDNHKGSSNVNSLQGSCKSREPDEKLDVAIGSCLALLQKLSRRDCLEEKEANAHRMYTEIMARCLCERMKALEKSMEGIDKKMETLFRCLIQTRVSFLNILSN